jgi:hypothetical protein
MTETPIAFDQVGQDLRVGHGAISRESAKYRLNEGNKPAFAADTRLDAPQHEGFAVPGADQKRGGQVIDEGISFGHG